jgi:hypothetical protein
MLPSAKPQYSVQEGMAGQIITGAVSKFVKGATAVNRAKAQNKAGEDANQRRTDEASYERGLSDKAAQNKANNISAQEQVAWSNYKGHSGMSAAQVKKLSGGQRRAQTQMGSLNRGATTSAGPGGRRSSSGIASFSGKRI